MKTWVQISAGRGPSECAWVVPRIARLFADEAAQAGCRADAIEQTPGPRAGTLVSALFGLESPGAETFLRGWLGTVQWIGRSPFRPGHKRKNWFVGVEALREPDAFAWSPKDLSFQTLRASGPGGQHVNKTESAVRVTHLPSGLSVLAREERSQHANRRLALARLAHALAARDAERRAGFRQDLWSCHNTLERGNPVRVYEGEDFARKA
ncbi:MAG: peptide chain release factor H [Planctomycetota bacterium]|nr:peptide chain release factor H [Planctomycetota bacterium]